MRREPRTSFSNTTKEDTLMTTTVGLLLTVEAKPGKAEDVAHLFAAAPDMKMVDVLANKLP